MTTLVRFYSAPAAPEVDTIACYGIKFNVSGVGQMGYLWPGEPTEFFKRVAAIYREKK